MAATGLPKQHVKCGDVAGENISDPGWGLRPGERLAVRTVRDFTSATTITLAHSEIANAIEWVQSQGAEVFELSSGETTGAGKGAQMVSRALSRIHGSTRMQKAKDMQKAAAKARTLGKMGENEAKAIWKNIRTYPRWQSAIAAMTGWNKNEAYKAFKGRGVVAGRPPKPKK